MSYDNQTCKTCCINLWEMNYINIPVELCEYVIRNNFYRPMQLYIYLNTHCSGKMKISSNDLIEIGKAIGLKSARAVTNNLQKLLDKNWIGYSKKSKYYFIRSIDKIRQLHNFKKRKAAEFDSRHIKKLKAFLAAAKIGYLLNIQQWRKRATERKHGRSKHIARLSTDFYPLANTALAKLLKISVSTAFQLKQLARKAGYIKIRKTFVKLPLDSSHRDFYKKAMPEFASLVKMKSDKLILQDVDMVSHNLSFRNRKKLETYIQGVSGGKRISS